MYTIEHSVTDADVDAIAKKWWIPVAVGICLILYAFIVLSFTIKTVWAVAIGLGIGLIASGIAELVYATIATSWRWLLVLIGLIDIGLGIAAFVWPEATFLVLARLVGWVLLFRGVVELIRAFEARRLGASDWWLFAVLGAFNIGIAFWATRYTGRSIVVLVLWVGIALLTRGIAAIVAGFALRSLRRRPAD